MTKTFDLTQCMALAHLHRSMKDFLYNYAEGRLDRTFFINGMDGLIEQINNIVRENGAYSWSYPRMLSPGLVAKAGTREIANKKELKKVLDDMCGGFVAAAASRLRDLIENSQTVKAEEEFTRPC